MGLVAVTWQRVGTREGLPVWELGPEAIEGCRFFGGDLNKNLSEATKAQAFHGIQHDDGKQTRAKIAEVIGIIDAGLDPNEPGLIEWQARKPEEEKLTWDYILGRWRVDVKQRWFRSQTMLYAKSKNLEESQCNALHLVKINQRLDGNYHGYSPGWLSKKEFLEKQTVVNNKDDPSEYNPDRLDTGTPWVLCKILKPMHELRRDGWRRR